MQPQNRQKLLPLQALLALFTLVVTAVVLTTATFAWFTFGVDTNITPLQGSIGNGDVNLTICATEGGEYDKTCAVTLLSECEELLPVSTADLENFYAATAQTKEGISIRYTDVTEMAPTRLIHGEVYLKTEHQDADVYFDRSRLEITGSDQLLGSLRLALKITGADEEKTYFFNLDELGGGGLAQDTTGQSQSVVSAVDTAGTATYTADPAESLAAYCAANTEGEDSVPEPGETALCRLTADQPAKVELWLYMEGCDENCLTEAAANDLDFNLAFAGVGVEEA